jgi:predicted transcriptional regulator
MLTDLDMKVLQTMSKQLLLRKSEIATKVDLVASDGIEVTLGRLIEQGYVEKVESLGFCYVITQRGLRVIKENNGQM